MEPDELSRRKILKFTGITTTLGLAGCLGGGSENPDAVEDEGPEPTGSSNGRFDQYAEEYDLTESGVGVLESYCEDLDADQKEHEKGVMDLALERSNNIGQNL